MADQKPATPAEGVVALLFLLGIGSCVFGGSDDKSSAPSPYATATQAVVPDNLEPGDASVTAGGSTTLEQAILDAFPAQPARGKADRKRASNAVDFVGAAINSAGYLCDQAVEAQKAATGQYGVSCRKHRDGGRANYLIDVRTGRVSEI